MTPRIHTEAAPITEMVGLLDRFAPAQIARLRSQYPDRAAELRAGCQLGGAAEAGARDLAFYLDVSTAAMDETEQLARRGLAIAAHRLSSASMWENIAQTVTILGSA